MVNRIGTNRHDDLDGTNLDDILIGKSGADTLNGFEGNDKLIGGEGNDKLFGGDGYNTLIGGAGDDTMSGGVDADDFRGGQGTDTVDYSGSTTGVLAYVHANMSNFGALGDSYTLVENVTGSAFDDYLQPEVGGLAVGNAGNDHLYGGASGDIFGGRLRGGVGYDTLDMTYGATEAQLQNGKGWDTISGFQEDNDTFFIKLSEFGLGNSLDSNEITNSDTVTAIGTNAQFIYEDDSQNMWFDSNGSDAGGLVFLAHLEDATITDHNLGLNDFHVV